MHDDDDGPCGVLVLGLELPALKLEVAGLGSPLELVVVVVRVSGTLVSVAETR